MQNLNQGKVVDIKVVSNEDKSLATKPSSLNAINPMSKIVNINPKASLKDVKVIKKDGTIEPYDVQKVIKAVKKSAARMLVDFSDKELETLCDYVNQRVLETGKKEIEISPLESPVETG